MKENSRLERKKQVQFAVGMAAIDGGKPSAFTQNLLNTNTKMVKYHRAN